MKYSANSVWENKDQYDIAVEERDTQDVKQRWRAPG